MPENRPLRTPGGTRLRPGRRLGPDQAPPPGDPIEPGWEPVITRPDPMSAEEWEAWLDHLTEDEPFDPEEYPDPDGPPPPGEDELTAEEIAGIAETTEAEARAAAAAARSGTTGALAALAARAGRRGPGQPGSARVFPGESSSRAAAFGTGLALDVMPGCPDLALLADAAAGDDDTYDGASDDELIGVLCAWDRLEAHMAARKLAAAAELIRRRPEPGCPPEGPAQMPAACGEFTAEELAYALAEHRGRAEELLTIAAALESRLPGTRAALRDGIIRLDKAWIIACATALLDPEEARAAEAMVLGRAGRLTPGGLRAAIARAVIDVAPDKARKRREAAARDARVQHWAEDSGNAALMGRELPPAEVLAADQRITAWARQLRAAGLDGDMDVLRARAYLDLLLGMDSRPGQDTAGRQDGGRARRRRVGAARPGPACWVLARGTGGRRRAGRVRRADQPDHPAGHPARPGRPARRDRRHRSHRPRPGPRPRPRRRRPPQDDAVRDRDRPGRARHRTRLRPARTQEQAQAPGQTRPAGRGRPAPRSRRRAGVRLHDRRPARTARRIRHLAAPDRDQRTARSDRRARPDHHRRL